MWNYHLATRVFDIPVDDKPKLSGQNVTTYSGSEGVVYWKLSLISSIWWFPSRSKRYWVSQITIAWFLLGHQLSSVHVTAMVGLCDRFRAKFFTKAMKIKWWTKKLTNEELPQWGKNFKCTSVTDPGIWLWSNVLCIGDLVDATLEVSSGLMWLAHCLKFSKNYAI